MKIPRILLAVLLHPLFWLAATLALLWAVGAFGRTPVASAYDCTTRHDLIVELREADRGPFAGLLPYAGARIDLDRFEGGGTTTRLRPVMTGVLDGVGDWRDGDPQTGRLVLRDLCSALDGEYMLTLGFDGSRLRCDVVDGATRTTGLGDDNTRVTFRVRRCQPVEPPSPAPTATATTVRAEPTQTAPTPIVILVPQQPVAAPVAPAPSAPVATPAAAIGTAASTASGASIRPPNTGDGGLR